METAQVMTRKLALQWLTLYFEFFTELRTIANDETGVITKKDIDRLSHDSLILAGEDAAYQIRLETA